MKKQFLVISGILAACFIVNAQVKPGVQTPTTRDEVRREIARERSVQEHLENQRTRPSFPNPAPRGKSIAAVMRQYRNLIKNIYRTPTNEELAIIAPKQEVVAQFSEFLKQSNTGIFKLVPDKGCFITDKIIVIKPECEIYTLPGFGSAYSFRVKTYRVPSVADLVYKDGKFSGGESLAQEFFVEIGDVPLEKIDLQTAGVKFLNDFNAEADEEKFKETAGQLKVGIEKDGFQYRSSSNVKTDSTYVLRSTAYKGKILRSFDGIIYYNELDWDKRKDVIVAFRVVRRDADKSVTILWKELKSRDAPKLIVR